MRTMRWNNSNIKFGVTYRKYGFSTLICYMNNLIIFEFTFYVLTIILKLVVCTLSDLYELKFIPSFISLMNVAVEYLFLMI